MNRNGELAAPDRRTRGGWGGVAVGGVALFWIGTLVGGALAPGYSARVDFISSLGGRGSEVAVLGIVTLAVLGLTHLAAAAALRGVVGVPLVLAGIAGLAVDAFRTGCPLGAAGCGSGANDAPADLADLVHVYAVTAYEGSLVVAMVVVAVHLARSRPVAAAVTVGVAVLSVVLALQIGGVDSGWWQRGWLAVNTGWLVLLMTRPPLTPTGVRRVRAGWWPRRARRPAAGRRAMARGCRSRRPALGRAGAGRRTAR